MANPALLTYADVDLELALTADYDITFDVAKAQRRVIALRRKLDFPQQVQNESQENTILALNLVQDQLRQVLVWLEANGPRSNQNPSCVHADFSTFRGYSPSYGCQSGGAW